MGALMRIKPVFEFVRGVLSGRRDELGGRGVGQRPDARQGLASVLKVNHSGGVRLGR